MGLQTILGREVIWVFFLTFLKIKIYQNYVFILDFFFLWEFWLKSLQTLAINLL